MTDHTRFDLTERHEPQPASAAPQSACPDCNGRRWHGRYACACLVREVRAQIAALTVRLAEQDETVAVLKVRVAELESSELLAWARREWEEWKARNA